MKDTNTGDQAQHGGQFWAPLHPHGFSLNLVCPQETSALSYSVLSSFLWRTEDAVPVRVAQTEAP